MSRAAEQQYAVWGCVVRRLRLHRIVAFVACGALLGGCASTAAIVKDSLDPKPLVANAFSRALFVSGDRKLSKAKKAHQTANLKSYPPLPGDEAEPRVRKFVREYAYAQRRTMKEYLARAGRFLPMIKAAAKDHGLPEDISYLVLLESGGNPDARSPANALGMWQFMPATARSYGLRVDTWVDERLDPEKSTKAAMLYLKDLYGMFGCWRLALSAYNSGENKLNKVLCKEDASEYEEICSSRMLKRETREFFPRFQAIALIAKSPAKYGFAQVETGKQSVKHELMNVDGSYSVETLARSVDVPTAVLAYLNPALIRGATPPEGVPYTLRVPLGKKVRLARVMQDLPEESAKRNIVHVVHKGDSVSRILKRYRCSRNQLACMNPDVNFRKRLRRGAKIVIPAKAVPKKSNRKGKRLSLLH